MLPPLKLGGLRTTWNFIKFNLYTAGRLGDWKKINGETLWQQQPKLRRVEAKNYSTEGAKSCDKYDYLTAVGCGVEVWVLWTAFVGMPGESKLGGWTDAQVDKAVMNFCENLWMDTSCGKRKQCFECDWFSGKKLPSELWPEKWVSRQGTPFKMSPSNHHMKSLAHSPDISWFYSFPSWTSLQVHSNLSGQWPLHLQYRQTPMNCRGMTLFPNCFAGTVNWLEPLWYPMLQAVLVDVVKQRWAWKRYCNPVLWVVWFVQLWQFSGGWRSQYACDSGY